MTARGTKRRRLIGRSSPIGHSAMAQRYAIASLAEAQAYLAHPVLGPRLQMAERHGKLGDRNAVLEALVAGVG